MYGGKVTDNDMKSYAKEIIDVANRYEVVNLKLEAEASSLRGVEELCFTEGDSDGFPSEK